MHHEDTKDTKLKGSEAFIKHRVFINRENRDCQCGTTIEAAASCPPCLRGDSFTHN